MRLLITTFACLLSLGLYGQRTNISHDGYLNKFYFDGQQYVMEKTQKGGIFGNNSKMVDRVYQQAFDFAARKDMDYVKVDTYYRPMEPGVFAFFRLTFRLDSKYVVTESKASIENQPLGQEFYDTYVEYFDKNGATHPIEGIYSCNYSITVTADGADFGAANQIEAASYMAVKQDGERKFSAFFDGYCNSLTLRQSVSDGFFIGNLKFCNSGTSTGTNITFTESALIEFQYDETDDEVKYFLDNQMVSMTTQQKKEAIQANLQRQISVTAVKMYPAESSNTSRRSKSGEWAGNGSGIIISESGYIITNFHVIDDAEKVEVEFVMNEEVQKFNAEIVQVDKVNDLAILKIFDMNFDGIKAPNYNFKTRSSDVGTKVYAYGYPMALSIMGKEIKITDGIISSKSGFDGDITTYQITAAIQGGNSGGPLFDDKGNLIGINSSGLSKDVADNVGYSIKSNYALNLIDVLPKSIDLPSSTSLSSLPLTEQIKEISKYVVLVKVK
jgi:S1-C subfamily serine protease